MSEPSGSLRKDCLGFSGVTAMAIALISPTMTAALIVPLMYSNAGNASWLAYLFGTVMLLFVALNLNPVCQALDLGRDRCTPTR